MTEFDLATLVVDIVGNMDVERIIDDIEQIQEMFEAPDIRALGFGSGSILVSAADLSLPNFD